MVTQLMDAEETAWAGWLEAGVWATLWPGPGFTLPTALTSYRLQNLRTPAMPSASELSQTQHECAQGHCSSFLVVWDDTLLSLHVQVLGGRGELGRAWHGYHNSHFGDPEGQACGHWGVEKGLGELKQDSEGLRGTRWELP